MSINKDWSDLIEQTLFYNYYSGWFMHFRRGGRGMWSRYECARGGICMPCYST